MPFNEKKNLTTDSASEPYVDPKERLELDNAAFIGKWIPGAKLIPNGSQKWSASKNDQRRTRPRAQSKKHNPYRY